MWRNARQEQAALYGGLERNDIALGRRGHLPRRRAKDGKQPKDTPADEAEEAEVTDGDLEAEAPEAKAVEEE